ncbi:hypothetical protein HK098_005530 [Nowakowskiella sp. JEL0407]|nr:hypothetical protein HK098_005530 [Nowakowskiella sp. JEL0407]
MITVKRKRTCRVLPEFIEGTELEFIEMELIETEVVRMQRMNTGSLGSLRADSGPADINISNPSNSTSESEPTLNSFAVPTLNTTTESHLNTEKLQNLQNSNAETPETTVLIELENRRVGVDDPSTGDLEKLQMSNKEKKRLKIKVYNEVFITGLKYTVLLVILIIYVAASGSASAIAGFNVLQSKFNETENFAPKISLILQTPPSKIAAHGAYLALLHTFSWMIFIPIYLGVMSIMKKHGVGAWWKVAVYSGCTVVMVLSYVFLNPLVVAVYLGVGYNALLKAYGIAFCFMMLYSLGCMIFPLIGPCYYVYLVAEEFARQYGVGIGAAGAAGAVAGLLLHPFSFVAIIAGVMYGHDWIKKRFFKK